MTTRTDNSAVKSSANNMCEAFVKVNEVWARCGVSPVEVHHRLTRARGGLILDDAGETYHLMCLCRRHHHDAHTKTDVHTRGLLLEGYVVSGGLGPEYSGPDQYLTKKYGRKTNGS